MAQLLEFYVRPVADFENAKQARAAFQTARDTFVQTQAADNARGLAIVRCSGLRVNGTPCGMKWARPFVLPSQDDFNLKPTVYNESEVSRQASGHRTTTIHTKNVVMMEQSRHRKHTTPSQWPAEEVAILKNLSKWVNVNRLPSLDGPLDELEKFNKEVYDGYIQSHKCNTKRKARHDHAVTSAASNVQQAHVQTSASSSNPTAQTSAAQCHQSKPPSGECRTELVISSTGVAAAEGSDAAHVTSGPGINTHEARVAALEWEVQRLRATVDTLCRMSRLGQLTSHRPAAATSGLRASTAQSSSESEDESASEDSAGSEDEEHSMARAHPHVFARQPAYETEQEEKRFRIKRRKQGEQASRWRAVPSEDDRAVAHRITVRNLHNAHRDM